MNKYIYLILKLLKFTKLRFFLSCLLFMMAFSLIMCALSLQNGFVQYIDDKIYASISEDEIIVREKRDDKSIDFNIFKKKENQLNEENINILKEIDGVKAVYREAILQLPTSISINLLNARLESDAPVIFMDDEYLNIDHDDEDVIPIILSRTLMGLYNLSLADSLGLPKANENLLLKRRLNIYFGYSSFLNFLTDENYNIKPAIVYDFSDRVSLIAITIPMSYFDMINENNDMEIKNISLRLKVDQRKMDNIIREIEDLGFTTDSIVDRAEQFNNFIVLFEVIIYTIITIISIFVFLFVIFLMWNILDSHKKFINILKILGGNISYISKLFILFLSTILTISFIISIFFTCIGVYYLNIYFQQIEIQDIINYQIFLLDFNVIIKTFIIVFIASILGCMIPFYDYIIQNNIRKTI